MTETEYFKLFKKKFLYQIDILPIKIDYAFYNYGIFIKVNNTNRKSFDIDLNTPVPEFIEIILNYLSNFYPKFSHKVIEYTDMTSFDLIGFIASNPNVSEYDIIDKKKKVEKKLNYVIEKVYSRDKTFVLIENDKKYLYKYPNDIKDFRLFIEKNNSKKKHLYEFIFSQCWMLKTYEKDFTINIRYAGKQMENFIKLNKKKIKSEMVFDEKLNCYAWGNYHVFFENDSLRDSCLKILK